MKTLIIIPARYGSSRLPGKPLKLIAGQTMLSRVVDVALAAAGASAARDTGDIEIVVATDDQRIVAHCEEIGAKHVMTPVSCPTGTDRALAALQTLHSDADNVINLQGDAPLTPPDFITAIIDAFSTSDADVITPVVQLDWSALDALRQSKLTTPFSGTTVTLDATGNALWFSKAIIPAIRDEEKLRSTVALSPIHRHIGVYGYRREMLARFVDLPQGRYEQLEGLEQLRVLENGYRIGCVVVDYAGRPSMSGVDSAEDIIRAEQLIRQQK